MIAVWIPVTVVPTSFATVAIETFITELSSVIRNCADASVINTPPEAFAVRSGAVAVVIRSPFPGQMIGSARLAGRYA